MQELTERNTYNAGHAILVPSNVLALVRFTTNKTEPELDI